MSDFRYMVTTIVPLMFAVACVALLLMVLLPQTLWDLYIGAPTMAFLVYCLVLMRRHRLRRRD